MASTPGVAPYFDLSFQHASGPVLRRMRRFGDRARFTDLIERIRQLAPDAGVRSNFIVGFPGETAEDLRELELFLNEARLDAIGIFGYSDEDGTEAATFADDDQARRGRGRPPGQRVRTTSPRSSWRSARPTGSARRSRCSSRR